MLFFKLKQKLSLVDDYIYLYRIKQYYSEKKYLFDEQIQELFGGIVGVSTDLLVLYERCFLRLKMLDDSFQVLKIQLDNTENIIFANNNLALNEEIANYKKNLQILSKIRENLPQKLKKLSLSDYEIGFILQNI